MNTRKLFTDPTEEHTDCHTSGTDPEQDKEKAESDCDSQRPTGNAEDYLGEKL